MSENGCLQLYSNVNQDSRQMYMIKVEIGCALLNKFTMKFVCVGLHMFMFEMRKYHVGSQANKCSTRQDRNIHFIY